MGAATSRLKHATAHFTRYPSGHRSIQPGEDWRWCYVDEMVAWSVATWHTRSRASGSRYAADVPLNDPRDPGTAVHLILNRADKANALN
jgi:hypothetical protein